jgi:hypothetical protein
MHKLIFIIFLQLILNTSAHAQYNPKYTVSGDSLLQKFKTMYPLDVLEKTDLTKVDIYDCYHNKELRPYLMMWLNKQLYFEHLNQQWISSSFNDEYKIYKVKGWLTNSGQNHLVDTVMNNSRLFQIYLDSVINEITAYKRELHFKKGSTLTLPNEAINFHARLKLPEAYTILYNYWKESGGGINSEYFYIMLAMHNPEAINNYNGYVESAIKSGSMQLLSKISERADYEYLYGSYAIDLKLKLLVVSAKTITSYPDENDNYIQVPFNINILDPLRDRCFSNSGNHKILGIIDKIYNPLDKIFELSYEELTKYSQEIIDNIEEFKKAAQLYKDKLIEEEQYWKVNMPYSK